MEIMFLFAAGWVLSHVFGEKRDEYEHAQDAHREKYMKRLGEKHPNWSQARRARYLQNAARRNALGHFAYLLRHGWSSTFNDFTHGWDKAKQAHKEWKAEHPKDGSKPSRWETFKAGWRTNKATRGAEKAKQQQAATTSKPTPKPTPDPDDGKPAVPQQREEPNPTPKDGPWLTDEQARDADILPWPSGKSAPANPTPGNNAGSTNGSTTVEYNFDASKAVIAQMGVDATAKLSVIEQIIADVMAAGDLKSDTETMSHLASLQEALSNVHAHAHAFIGSVNKHAAGQEYANTGHAASTEYLKSS